MLRSLAVSLVGLLALSACGGGGDSDPAPADGPGPGGCRSVEVPEPRQPVELRAPTEPLAAGTTYRVEVSTNCGSFTIELDQTTSPKAAASFAALARGGFFDSTTFHRIVPGFVIQGGDPTGTGSGGPGYQTVDPPAADTKYTFGMVAMAKAVAEPRGAAGSQFFVLTGDAPTLPPDYAVIGRVSAGIGVVVRIGKLGDQSQQPTETVIVEKTRVVES